MTESLVDHRIVVVLKLFRDLDHIVQAQGRNVVIDLVVDGKGMPNFRVRGGEIFNLPFAQAGVVDVVKAIDRLDGTEVAADTT